MNAAKISLADRVYDELEDAILDGKYKPGEYLTENRLSGELGVSRTPIREAMRRLAQEDLIEETARGALVLGVTEEDINVIYEIRARIEGYAARLFAERADEKALSALRENLELQEFYSGRDNADSSGELDSRFHETIYENCGSRVLEGLLTTLHRKVRRFRRASYKDRERAGAAAREHRAIYEAVAARDGELIEALVTRHIGNAKASIIRNLKERF